MPNVHSYIMWHYFKAIVGGERLPDLEESAPDGRLSDLDEDAPDKRLPGPYATVSDET